MHSIDYIGLLGGGQCMNYFLCAMISRTDAGVRKDLYKICEQNIKHTSLQYVVI